MTEREHFIATLQACYFGDRNAFNEIVSIYDELENMREEIREYIKNNTMWFDKDYIKTYGELCSMAGAGNTRTPVLVNIRILENILNKTDKE